MSTEYEIGEISRNIREIRKDVEGTKAYLDAITKNTYDALENLGRIKSNTFDIGNAAIKYLLILILLTLLFIANKI